MKITKYFKVLGKEGIARRYFVMNSFDGALTILGVLIGMYLAGIDDARVVIVSCLGAAIAMAVSGVWGAYASERAERMRSLRNLEKYMLRDLGETRIGRRVRMMSFLIALVDGLSPLIVSLILIIPFFLSQTGFYPITYAFYYSMVLVLVILFLLGVFVGKIGNENLIKSGMKMVLAGVLVGFIVILLDSIKVV